MALKTDANFEGKLTCATKNEMKTLTNFRSQQRQALRGGVSATSLSFGITWWSFCNIFEFWKVLPFLLTYVLIKQNQPGKPPEIW